MYRTGGDYRTSIEPFISFQAFLDFLKSMIYPIPCYNMFHSYFKANFS
jgi:hypothetical protein